MHNVCVRLGVMYELLCLQLQDAAEKAVAEKAAKEEVCSSGTPIKTGGAHLERIVRQNLYGTACAPTPMADKSAQAQGGQPAEETSKKASPNANEETKSEAGNQSSAALAPTTAPTLTDAEMEIKERELTHKCLEQIGSCSPLVFSIRLNPDIYLPIIKHKGVRT